MNTFDPNHMPAHRADRDTDSQTLVQDPPVELPQSGIVLGKRRKFLISSAERILRQTVRDEAGSAAVLAVLILGMFGAFVLVVAMAARSFAGIQ